MYVWMKDYEEYVKQYEIWLILNSICMSLSAQFLNNFICCQNLYPHILYE